MFQRRSDNREVLRRSQASEANRSSYSKDKSLYSKKDNQADNVKSNLRDSTASLPVNFQHQRLSSLHEHHQISQPKQIWSPGQDPRPQIIHIRQYSMPANTVPVSTIPVNRVPVSRIVVKQAVESTVKFHYPQPTEFLKVEIEPAYRCSLPLNGRLTKNEIIRAEQIRQASRSVRMFSHFPTPTYQAHPSLLQYPSQVRLSAEVKPKYGTPTKTQSISIYADLQESVVSKSQGLHKTQQILQESAPSMLTNKLYVECIQTTDTATNTDSEALLNLETSQIKVVQSNTQKSQESSRVGRLIIPEEGLEKQNMQTKIGSSVCEKIKNFSQCSQIRINVNQVLKPKKNFIFV